MIAFWHRHLLLMPYSYRGRRICVLISASRDGERIARTVARFGIDAARGSSSRGGAEALEQMAECMAHGIDTGFTIDGPHGPRYVAKLGAIRLAATSGQPVLPFSISPRRFWTVPNWDGMQIPRPFTRAVMLVGEPIRVHAGDGELAIARAQEQLQASLDDLRARGDAWWSTGPPAV